MHEISGPNPVEFRGRLCADILASVARGESCTVIGVGSAGKSNVARHLVRRDVRERALGPAGARTLGVYCDFAAFSSATPQALQLVLLEELPRAPFPNAESVEGAKKRAELTHLWEMATVADAALRVFAYLRDAVDLILSRDGVDRIFFVLDDFDKALASADAAALNSLRKLRDDFKNRLTYVVVAWKELQFTRKPTTDYKDFYELVCNRVHPVGPYDAADAQRMFDRLASGAAGSQRVWPAAERDRMVWLTGGHAGILAMVYQAAEQGAVSVLSPDADRKLAQRPKVSLACETIWDSLDAQERAGLEGVIGGAGPGESTAGRLQKKGLLTVDGPRFRLFSPIFEAFLRTRHGAGRAQASASMGASRPAQAVVSFQPARSTIVIDNRSIDDLDPIGYALLEKLTRAEGKAVPPRELLEVVLAIPPRAGRHRGAPDIRLDRTLEDLLKRVNLPDRKYITVDAAGTYRFN
ncbi:MAG: ATP-binding protein [Thermoflexales bacterium]